MKTSIEKRIEEFSSLNKRKHSLHPLLSDNKFLVDNRRELASVSSYLKSFQTPKFSLQKSSRQNFSSKASDLLKRQTTRKSTMIIFSKRKRLSDFELKTFDETPKSPEKIQHSHRISFDAEKMIPKREERKMTLSEIHEYLKLKTSKKFNNFF